MADYLIDESPLVILPTLATKLGLNEAIILQQIHYWLVKKKNEKEGYYWAYNSYSSWKEQFPFWSESTIKRAITNLENKGILISDNFNKMKQDKTKWYRIDYELYRKLLSNEEFFDGKIKGKTVTCPSGQIDLSIDSNCTDRQVNVTQAIPNTISYTTTDTNKDINTLSGKPSKSSKLDNIPYAEIINHLNETVNKKYGNIATNKKLIKDRFKEGFTLEDFITVIDKKSKQWLNTDYAKYLRPATLFGNKFDGYLNEEIKHYATNKQSVQQQYQQYNHYDENGDILEQRAMQSTRNINDGY